MENPFEKLSDQVLEAILTDCLNRMEGNENPSYVNKQILLFRQVERELIRRNKYAAI